MRESFISLLEAGGRARGADAPWVSKPQSLTRTARGEKGRRARGGRRPAYSHSSEPQ